MIGARAGGQAQPHVLHGVGPTREAPTGLVDLASAPARMRGGEGLAERCTGQAAGVEGIAIGTIAAGGSAVVEGVGVLFAVAIAVARAIVGACGDPERDVGAEAARTRREREGQAAA